VAIPSGPGTLRGSIFGHPVALTSAIVRDDYHGFRLIVAARAIACDSPLGAQPTDTSLEVDLPVPLAPDLAGRSIGVPMVVGTGPAASPTWSHAFGVRDADVTLEPFTLEVGGRLRGRLRLDARGFVDGEVRRASLAGSFDATICSFPAEATAIAQPSTTPTGPIAGTVAGEPFAVARAFAHVSASEIDERPHVERIDLVRSTDVTCEGTLDVAGLVRRGSVALGEMSGAGPGPLRLESRAPASAMFLGEGWSSIDGDGRAWITWHAVSFTPGEHVRATVVVDGEAGNDVRGPTHLEGQLDAVVCPRTGP
jgi:hypothetical protein